jgi:DNA-binding CsgD family transcriptional regulator
MWSSDPAPQLYGRRSELRALEELLEAVRLGESRSMVIRGEAGIGKTALLRYLAEQSSGCTVVRMTGAQSDMELAYAGLHQFCTPLMGGLERLPDPQRESLSAAFGLADGRAPDRFFVGLAVLSLLAEVATERPLVCLVDDTQWLDTASVQVLAFVARRLAAESVALVLAVRTSETREELSGLPELSLAGLNEVDARALLDSVITGPLDERVRARIVAETHGNPLALLELPRGLTPAQLAGGFGLPSGPTLPDQIEESFQRRYARLPADTQRLLLVAAADPLGEPLLMWRAAQRLGIAIAAATAAEADDLIEIGARVRFRHPLVRSAVYRAASPAERRSAHAALAEATDGALDPDRRAWHRAHAAPGPAAEVADELERSAGRAHARGGFAAAAAFLERAAALSPDPAQRGERALRAAQAKQLAGVPDRASALLAAAEACPLDEHQRARIDLLRGHIAFSASRGRDASPLLLRAAKRLETLDPARSRDTYLEALAAARFFGLHLEPAGVVEVATAARAGPSAVQPSRQVDLLLDGISTAVLDGYGAAAPLLKGALEAVRADERSDEDAVRWLWIAVQVARDLWDDESYDALCTRLIESARRAGALSVLPVALTSRMGMYLYTGELAEAAVLLGELEAVTGATGSRLPPYGALALACNQGLEPEARALIEHATAEASNKGEGMGLSVVQHSAAVLYNGLGLYDEALAAARAATNFATELGFTAMVLPELIEAAARAGAPEEAADALNRLNERANASGTNWALGLAAYSNALLADDDNAEALYREAISLLSRTRLSLSRARACLVYGEWLRHVGRRLDAREQLREAHEQFAAMGAGAFAARAGRELEATGGVLRKRQDDPRDELTPQELQIARLAIEGQTNAEIGAELFLSPRTVEWHLRKVFIKLGIKSRRELSRAVPATGSAAAAK